MAAAQVLVKADPNHRHTQNSDGETPIYIAVKLGHLDILKMMCAILKAPAFEGPDGRTALHAAVTRLPKDCVRYVLEHTSNLVTSCDEDGKTPLHYAVLHKFDSVLDKIVKATVEASIDRFSTDYEGMVPTPLWLAMEGGFTSTVIQLITLLPGVCLEINHDNKRNILHFAAFRSDKKMVQAILKYCPRDDIDTLVKGKDDNGDTPLHLLIDQGCFIADLLKYERVVRMVKNKQDMTPLDMLYKQDKIIADQNLMVRKLINIHVPSWKRSEKDDKFKRKNKELMKAELIQYKDRTNAQIIVTALIVTVTFTVGFTMPGGYYQSGDLNQGLVLLSKKRAFSAFMISDALALALSTISLFLYFISTTYEDPQLVSKLNGVSSVLTVVSVVAMMLTFTTGTYAVLSHSPHVAITVCIICSTFFLFIIVFLIIEGIYDRENIEENVPSFHL
ncbi:hypothetical protein DCAR_0207077 [Daucus carota subsp. sativus]|uniref:PGG domain-containing protein n=1 Tax=Daucus carota subsp. sativus TaxID=79200 RepID=A0AAF0WDC6_DAUCS|nr:hypothetical protein DCAR_0207077 [Daucus carota subsp. sativus]